ncbi:MAG: hypothetical protein K0Q76_2976 [Panacagrimonas sp.]|nr:DUF2970 domain-containing protein [Panacagrimonas sp.]MCC2657868.1 hypothetical protein [Panacagrimonas sp.]
MSGSPPPKRPTLLQEIGSVLASFFGVQSSRNRRRDFTQGSPLRFVAIGLLMTAAFVLIVYAVVQLVLRSAAS